MLAKKLKKGDKIGVISPSENVKKEDLSDINESIKLLNQNGYDVVIAKNAYKNTTGYGATAKEKAEDIHEMHENSEIKAIFSIKGGFNSNSIYEYLDLDLIKNNNKILCGYSDATSYINYIQAKTGNSCFIGPNLKSLNSWETDYSFKEMLNHFENGSNNLLREDDEVICIKKGEAKGRLIGGNLSLISNMLDELDFSNKIIFIEEFAFESPPAMVSNHLYKMKQKGIFNKVKGIWLGNYDGEYSLEKILMDTIKDLNLDIPIIKTNNFGHTEKKMTIPLGIEAKVTEDNIQIIEKYLED